MLLGEDKDYYFDVNGEPLLHLKIDVSFSQDAYFIVVKNDGYYVVYWRKEIDKKTMCQKISSLPEDKGLSSFFKSENYQKFKDDKSVINFAVISDDIKNVIDDILQNGLAADVRHTYGRDGHGYTLTTYQPKINNYFCGGSLPKEWEIFKTLINYLVELAGLDFSNYGARINKERN